MNPQLPEQPPLDALEARIGYTFSNRSLLETALTHTSFVKGDGRHAQHNERMEFLGDAVLELIVSRYLYGAYPSMNEGQMTRMRASLVCERSLFTAACALELPAWLRLGNGEEQTGGRKKPSVVSDALEAVICAVFLDGGNDAAEQLVTERILPLLKQAAASDDDKDYKTRLQELVQRDHIGQLSYRLLGETGPEHSKLFTMAVLLSEKELGRGVGQSKQSAGQAAAQAALAALADREAGV